MAIREAFTPRMLNSLRSVRAQRQEIHWDGKEIGLCVLRSPGPKDKGQSTLTFRVAYYLPSQPGKPQYVKLGRYPDGEYVYPYKDEKGQDLKATCSDIKAIRNAARDIRNRAEHGIDPKRPVASGLFEDVVKNFLALHAKKNRTFKETERIFSTYVLPEWRYLLITDITREKHVIPLLDKLVQKKFKVQKTLKGGRKKELWLGGEPTANAVLAQITKLFNWHATRSEFRTPIVKGMRIGPSMKERARDRVLSDDELRVLWPILGELGTYGAALKCMLLTAQRARKVMAMQRSDLKDNVVIPSHVAETGQRVPEMRVDNIWDPTRDNDPKNKQVSVVPLSTRARQVIDALPIIDTEQPGDYIFSIDGRRPLRGWSKSKRRLDGKMLAVLRQQATQAGQDPNRVSLKPWQLRDLRRSARTLFSRAGVLTEISELCLAHTMPVIRGTYDRFNYLPQKREAFEKLASELDHILKPPRRSTRSRRAA
jgi:hypothetical protein